MTQTSTDTQPVQDPAFTADAILARAVADMDAALSQGLANLRYS